MMSVSLHQEPVFTALTRPQMFLGVTYSFFVGNCIVAAELFLIFKSFWTIGVFVILHLAGGLLCLHEPRFFDLWIVRLGRCSRVKNYGIWGCNSYQP